MVVHKRVEPTHPTVNEYANGFLIVLIMVLPVILIMVLLVKLMMVVSESTKLGSRNIKKDLRAASGVEIFYQGTGGWLV